MEGVSSPSTEEAFKITLLIGVAIQSSGLSCSRLSVEFFFKFLELGGHLIFDFLLRSVKEFEVSIVQMLI